MTYASISSTVSTATIARMVKVAKDFDGPKAELKAKLEEAATNYTNLWEAWAGIQDFLGFDSSDTIDHINDQNSGKLQAAADFLKSLDLSRSANGQTITARFFNDNHQEVFMIISVDEGKIKIVPHGDHLLRCIDSEKFKDPIELVDAHGGSTQDLLVYKNYEQRNRIDGLISEKNGILENAKALNRKVKEQQQNKKNV